MVQTESPTYVRRAIAALRKPEMFPRSRICLLCREEDADRFSGISGLERILTYSRQKVWRSLGLRRDLKGFDADMVAAVFSGRRVFRKQKLLYFLLPIRHHLAFNARSDCYRLTPRTLFWTFRKDPSFFAAEKQPVSPILFFPTAEDSKAVEAIQRLQDPKIAAKSIVVFCREDKRLLYEDLPTVEAVWTYAPGSSLRHLMTWVRLLRTRVDLVCAIFSGRPTFRLQKFLFLTLRARNRLVFNEDLNCYMLRGHLARFLQPQGRNRGLDRSVLILVVRKVLKWFLFVPRFLYLILWAAVVTMRARRRISQERSRAKFSPDC